ncbi:hypothetical protein [Geobacillus kaustophilus]|uniref:hypothetical protein n=1 Tax=Geobacillus kaustophilus TaxID=1462 RepID=UPI0005CCEAF9|nr:hypothetical protein [Geobacillus kaustophilus]
MAALSPHHWGHARGERRDRDENETEQQARRAARAVDAKAAGRASTSMREQAVQDACKEREDLTAD